MHGVGHIRPDVDPRHASDVPLMTLHPYALHSLSICIQISEGVDDVE